LATLISRLLKLTFLTKPLSTMLKLAFWPRLLLTPQPCRNWSPNYSVLVFQGIHIHFARHVELKSTQFIPICTKGMLSTYRLKSDVWSTVVGGRSAVQSGAQKCYREE
jgi:hypothetical protein